MCLKDVLDFSSNSLKNEETELTYKYFNYALEKEIDMADIILTHFINSGKQSGLIENLQILKNKKEKEDLSEIIDSERKCKEIRRI